MNKQTLTLILSTVVVASANAQTAVGATAPVALNLGGVTQTDGWTDLSAASNPGYGAFPGAGPWPAPIESNVGGNAQLAKVANGAGGGPFIATGSLYFGGFSTVPNTFGGTVAVRDSSPVAGLKTLVLQIQIGEASTYDLWNDAGAVLSYNGGSQSVTANFRSLFAQQFIGTVNMPTGTENLYNNLHAFQWDLSSIAEPITDFSISFSGAQHAQVYGLQLDQSSQVYTDAVPEPATMTVLAFGAMAAFARRRKKA